MVRGPIAYTYEADYHCEQCAVDRFGLGVSGDDGEGNPVGAVFPWDEWQQFTGEPETLACGTCHAVIDEYVPA